MTRMYDEDNSNEHFRYFNPRFLQSTGYRLALQCPQSRPTLASRTGCAETGSLFGVWRCDVDFATLFLHAGCSLVGLHLVLYRKNRCRQWGENRFSSPFDALTYKINLMKQSKFLQVQYSWLWKLANVTQSPYSYVWSNDTRLPELVNGPPRRTMYVTALYFTMTCMTSVGFESESWL